MQVKERAILLTKTKYSEADLILKYITANGEVYSAIAKSALKSKKRFGGGVLEPIHYVLLTVDRRENRLAILNEAQLLDDFRGLKTEYERLELALYFVKVVATVAREGDLHQDLFNLLGHALKAAAGVTDLQLLKIQFNLKLLHLQGVLPPDEKYAQYLRASISDGLSKTPSLAMIKKEYQQISSEVEIIFADYVL
ncbi:MAG: DNA repair protein RecO [Bdellovibrionales bacterium RBG_16_40_8]|nr:MAG: DNA repair protein RecO [Bdellovibrionales bacterium RBG_16_40_8]